MAGGLRLLFKFGDEFHFNTAMVFNTRASIIATIHIQSQYRLEEKKT